MRWNIAKACPTDERPSVHPKNLGSFFRIEKMMWHKRHSVAVAHPFPCASETTGTATETRWLELKLRSNDVQLVPVRPMKIWASVIPFWNDARLLRPLISLPMDAIEDYNYLH